ncbi:MAG TPA: hypothetical protein VF070_14285 [Streptosporangiaceae bacterium]
MSLANKASRESALNDPLRMAARLRWTSGPIRDLPSSSSTISSASPNESASASDSASSATIGATAAFSTILSADARPAGPRWTGSPSAPSRARERSNVRAWPPARIRRLPSRACGTLPRTGASRNSTGRGPADSASPASGATSDGLTVDIWINTSGGALSRPSGPVRTSRTAVASASIVMANSLRRPASAGVPAARAPSAASGAVAAGVLFHTMSW